MLTVHQYCCPCPNCLSWKIVSVSTRVSRARIRLSRLRDVDPSATNLGCQWTRATLRQLSPPLATTGSAPDILADDVVAGAHRSKGEKRVAQDRVCLAWPLPPRPPGGGSPHVACPATLARTARSWCAPRRAVGKAPPRHWRRSCPLPHRRFTRAGGGVGRFGRWNWRPHARALSAASAVDACARAGRPCACTGGRGGGGGGTDDGGVQRGITMRWTAMRMRTADARCTVTQLAPARAQWPREGPL